MDRFSVRSLKDTSGYASSQAAYPPRKLALLHTGAALLVSLVLTVLHYLLSRGIGTTGGLSGIGTRTVLTSLQTILQFAASLALPFWEVGFLFCMLRLARKEPFAPRDLTAGFRRFSVLLRLMFLEFLLYSALAFIAIQLVTLVFSLTPFSMPVMEKLSALMRDEAFLQSGTLPPELQGEIIRYLIPVYIVSGVLFLTVGIPVFYRLRFSRYVIMDTQQPRALAAMGISRRLTKGHCRQLFSLDLSYWWYYLLQIVIAAAAYADLLFPLLGISMEKETAFFGTFAIHLLLSLLLAWRCRAGVDGTYACFYLQLQTPENLQLPPS
ncbi:MAG: DUF975 family protein [Oscillospiraceae bacterium]|nr:DUF975 family protein [Oscillospiraceae bacterium]